MKMFDMHIHTLNTSEANADELIRAFEEAGIWGGCIFSSKPLESNLEQGLPFEDRMEQVLTICKNYPNRLFPVLWIHPEEENILEKIQIAADRGIAAFKMICDRYYIYEEKPMEVLRAIANTGKPVIFHTGILWMNSFNPDVSGHNRPLNWEALMTIPNLKFSMGHCSWPWTDECIALFGAMEFGSKFYAKEGETPAQMYFDLTPGTPDIYREDLLTKLFSHRGDVINRVFFGTDLASNSYNSSRAKKLLEQDRKIFDKLGISIETRNHLYYQNLLRFLGREDLIIDEDCYHTDTDGKEIPYSPKTADIIEKWYKKLGFPMEYDREFKDALSEYKISDAITIDGYDMKEKDGRRNLLSFLFMCEELERKYAEKGIDKKILLDTLGDILLWTNTWTDVKGEMYLGEIGWLSNYLKMNIFRLGQLEFAFGKACHASHELGLSEGDNIIEVHIPSGAKLTPEECEKSFNLAKEFFAKYYPEYEYSHFTCHSWFMDTELKKLLHENSNILKFQESFTLVESAEKEGYDALKYVFRWNTTRQNLRNAVCVSSFGERLKNHVMNGGKLNLGYGIKKK